MSCFYERISAKFDSVVRVRDDMHDYQKAGYQFLMDNPFSALFIDMGMGKTVTSLTVISDVLSQFLCEKVLVVGPLRVATNTWPTEIGLWDHLAPFNYKVIHAFDDDPRLAEARREARREARLSGKSTEECAQIAQKAETAERERIRIEAAADRASIHIVSQDWLEWLVNHHGRNWPYRTVVIDESSGFKNHQSLRFKAIAKVRNTKGLITRMHLLTATPAAETYEHLFAQIFLLDRGERFGKTITPFREEFFTYNRWTRKWKIRPGAEETILEKISDICLVMKAEDYLDVEKPTIVRRSVRMSDHQIDLYNTMQEDFVVTLDDGTEVEAETAAALSSKLLQMASGVLYETVQSECPETGDLLKSTKVHKLHDHKIDELKQIVDELCGKPLLVAYHFRSSLERLKKAFPKAVVMDREGKCVSAWNKGKIPILLMHPKSGGHGLNLQAGGHNIVFFDIPWSLELFLQFIGRLSRQGQKHPVLVQLLTCTGTLDDTVADALEAKEDGQERMFSILKRLILKYRRSKRRAAG